MQHTVRRNLLGLGAGVVVQRVLQLIAFLLVGARLGVDGLGVHAKGQAVAAVLAVLAGAGVRNLVAREVARQPGAARRLVSRAVRVRLALGLALTALATAIAFATAAEPWFWLLWTLHTAPAAFDLKNLIDAAGRTGREVLIETLAATLQLLAFAVWWLSGDGSLVTLAAISLGCRVVYALGAATTIRRLPDREAPELRGFGWQPAGLGQTAHELMAIGDVALVAFACGDRAAGFYAIAARLALAALLPSTQLARLLLPHLLHAARSGDSDRTLRTALRATAWVTLPFAAGGALVAPMLCAVSGDEFRDAAAALRLLLLAGCLQHLGWQLSHALLADGRDRAYAHGLGWPALLQAAALGALSLLARGATATPHHVAAL
ncbi:MAG: hypothetical protein H6835_20200, partial [Planctomycetes bacterium]|nr:hypothetical protein [Planctomycetota bacterium]